MTVPRPVRRPTVGLFDSGVGGLSVLRRMLEVASPPWGRIVYLADLAHFPYGPRPLDEVRRLALAGVDLLAGRGADVVAVACNTAAASGVRAGLVASPVPVLDIVGPGARDAAETARRTAASRVLVLGTEGTIGSGVWEAAVRGAGYPGLLVGWACPFLAKLIEEGRNGPAARDAVESALRGLATGLSRAAPVDGPVSPVSPGDSGGAGGGDVVILGCTHYPFAAPVIAEVLAASGRPVTLVDPARALVRELLAVLGGSADAEEGIASTGAEEPVAEEPVSVSFLTTGREPHFRRRVAELLGDRDSLSG